MRIVTLNTWKNEGDFPRRLAAMAAGLRALAPDVMLLQEVFRTCDDAVHTARTLADALRLTMIYAPARTKVRRWHARDVPSESGLAILARGAVTWSERLPLPSDEIGGERIALLAEIRVDDASIVAGCMHLSHVRGDHARRREQLETILAHPAWTSRAALRVLGGDCNATLDAPALEWIERHPTLTIQPAQQASDSPPTHPLPPRSDRPGRTIDHLFLISQPAEHAPVIRTACAALAHPIDTVFASDHAAVLLDAEMAASVTRASPRLNPVCTNPG